MTAAGIPFRAVPAGPLVGVRPVAMLRHLARLVNGTWVAWRWLRRERPDAVLVTGGYVSVPMAVAARWGGVPLAVFLPDVRPGWAVRLIARLADRVATSTEAARAFLPRQRTVVTGYPVRPAVRAARRADARAGLGLAPEDVVVLVFGGSQGARRLNRAVAAAAERLLAGVVLLQIAGPRDLAAARAARDRLPATLARRLRVFEYLDGADMAAALAAADLVVCRAGAATLGELPARGLPAILVPLPIAGGHQRDNAQVLVDAGAAVLVEDAHLDGDHLTNLVTELLADPARLARMGRAARGLDRPDAAAAVWRVVAELARRAAGTDVGGQPRTGGR